MNIETRIIREQDGYQARIYWGEKINEHCKQCGEYGFGCRGLKNRDTDGGKCDCWARG